MILKIRKMKFEFNLRKIKIKTKFKFNSKIKNDFIQLPGDKTVIAAWTALLTKLSNANIQCGLILCDRSTVLTASLKNKKHIIIYFSS